MNTEHRQITVNGLAVQIARKAIKNLHLGVYPPHGRVRVAAPLLVSDEAVRLAVIGKLGWIKRQQARFTAQERQSAREYVTGESHYYLGRRYRLSVVVQEGPGRAVITNRSVLTLFIPAGRRREQRARVVTNWYRAELQRLAAPLVQKWAAAMGLEVPDWRVQRMKTRWGTCDAEAGRICINLELVKKPPHCLEYVIIHELAHFYQRHHNDRFTAIMNRYLPQWQLYLEELNREPLAHEHWKY